MFFNDLWLTHHNFFLFWSYEMQYFYPVKQSDEINYESFLSSKHMPSEVKWRGDSASSLKSRKSCLSLMAWGKAEYLYHKVARSFHYLHTVSWYSELFTCKWKTTNWWGWVFFLYIIALPTLYIFLQFLKTYFKF